MTSTDEEKDEQNERKSSDLDSFVIVGEDNRNEEDKDTSGGGEIDGSSSKDEYNALIKTLSSSSSSLTSLTSENNSSDDSSKKTFKKKRKKLKSKLKEAKDKLEKEISVSETLKKQLRDETDAKERVEANISELQEKYKERLKHEESLQTKFNNKKNYCDILARRLLDLNQELPSEYHDNSDIEDDENGSELPGDENDLKNKYEEQINDLKSSLQELDNENVALKHKIFRYEGGDDSVDLTEEEKEKILPLVEKQVKFRMQEMNNRLTDQSELQSKIRTLENKLKTTEENCDEYMKKYKEAIVALKEIKEAYGDQRDEIVQKFKEENESLKEQLQNPNLAKPNEDIVTTLRQEILDARLALERNKKSHQEELQEDKKKIQVAEENLKNTVECLEENSSENQKLKKELNDRQNILTATEDVSNQRMQIINELKLEIASYKDNIQVLNGNLSTKNDDIADLRSQLAQKTEILTKEHMEKKNLEKELEICEQVKEENQTLMEDMDEMKSKVKTKKLKVKFLKKQIKEFEDQREKLEKFVFVVPEMQRNIDQLEKEKQDLRDQLANQIQKEEDRILQLELEKKEREDRIQKNREDWERRLLGIGECDLYHGNDADAENSLDLTESFSRPSSAPLMKPRPPSARRYNTANGHRRTQTNPPLTLNPSYLNSSQEGRKTSEKVRNHQQRIIMSGKNQKKLFRSATQQMNHLNSFTHTSPTMEDRFFPNLRTKKRNQRIQNPDHNGNVAPRVLVWGSSGTDEEDELAGKKLVAVGDRVMANILRDCSFHGRDSAEFIGLVKFIGFIKGNQKDVYIGLRMDDEVGNTDGFVDGKRYFRCEPNRGKFVRLDDVVRVLDTRTITHHSPVS